MFGLDCVQSDTWDQDGELVEVTACLTTGLVLLFNLIDESPNRDTLDAPFRIFVLCGPRFSRIYCGKYSEFASCGLCCATSSVCGFFRQAHGVRFVQCLNGLLKIGVGLEIISNVHRVPPFVNGGGVR